MKKEINYVECQGCNWRIEQQPDFDWSKNPCRDCNNTRQVIDPKDILCNMCGGTMCPLGTMNEQRPNGLYNSKVSGGYESYHLLDMTSYIFSLCEECLRKLFIQCKIPPKVIEYGIDQNLDGSLCIDDRNEQSWEDDQKYYEFRVWKDNGGHHQAYLDRKCNAVKNCPNKAKYTLLHDYTKFTEEALCEEHKDHSYVNSSLTKFIPNVLKPFL
jgi:hypothetical protein